MTDAALRASLRNLNDCARDRWSPRSFESRRDVDDELLDALLLAAGRAPSAGNSQPWRFAVGRRGRPVHAIIERTLDEGNREWASEAPVLIALSAHLYDDEGVRRRWAEYDTGQAAAFLLHQVHASGLHARQMGGFDAAALQSGLRLSADVLPCAVMAIGSLDPLDAAWTRPDRRDTTRRPVSEIVLGRDVGLHEAPSRR